MRLVLMEIHHWQKPADDTRDEPTIVLRLLACVLVVKMRTCSRVVVSECVCGHERDVLVSVLYRRTRLNVKFNKTNLFAFVCVWMKSRCGVVDTAPAYTHPILVSPVAWNPTQFPIVKIHILIGLKYEFYWIREWFSVYGAIWLSLMRSFIERPYEVNLTLSLDYSGFVRYHWSHRWSYWQQRILSAYERFRCERSWWYLFTSEPACECVCVCVTETSRISSKSKRNKQT